MTEKEQEEIWKDKLERDYCKITDYNDIERFTDEDCNKILYSILDYNNISGQWNWLQSKDTYEYFSGRFPSLHEMIDSAMEVLTDSWEDLKENQKDYSGPKTIDGISVSYITMYLTS